MKITKTLGSELYSLFGPNGSDGIVHSCQKRRMPILKELERHGLVKLTPREDGIFEIVRNVCRKP